MVDFNNIERSRSDPPDDSFGGSYGYPYTYSLQLNNNINNYKQAMANGNGQIQGSQNQIQNQSLSTPQQSPLNVAPGTSSSSGGGGGSSLYKLISHTPPASINHELPQWSLSRYRSSSWGQGWNLGQNYNSVDWWWWQHTPRGDWFVTGSSPYAHYGGSGSSQMDAYGYGAGVGTGVNQLHVGSIYRSINWDRDRSSSLGTGSILSNHSSEQELNLNLNYNMNSHSDLLGIAETSSSTGSLGTESMTMSMCSEMDYQNRAWWAQKNYFSNLGMTASAGGSGSGDSSMNSLQSLYEAQDSRYSRGQGTASIGSRTGTQTQTATATASQSQSTPRQSQNLSKWQLLQQKLYQTSSFSSHHDLRQHQSNNYGSTSTDDSSGSSSPNWSSTGATPQHGHWMWNKHKNKSLKQQQAQNRNQNYWSGSSGSCWKFDYQQQKSKSRHYNYIQDEHGRPVSRHRRRCVLYTLLIVGIVIFIIILHTVITCCCCRDHYSNCCRDSTQDGSSPKSSSRGWRNDKEDDGGPAHKEAGGGGASGLIPGDGHSDGKFGPVDGGWSSETDVNGKDSENNNLDEDNDSQWDWDASHRNKRTEHKIKIDKHGPAIDVIWNGGGGKIDMSQMGQIPEGWKKFVRMLRSQQKPQTWKRRTVNGGLVQNGQCLPIKQVAQTEFEVADTIPQDLLVMLGGQGKDKDQDQGNHGDKNNSTEQDAEIVHTKPTNLIKNPDQSQSKENNLPNQLQNQSQPEFTNCPNECLDPFAPNITDQDLNNANLDYWIQTTVDDQMTWVGGINGCAGGVKGNMAQAICPYGMYYQPGAKSGLWQGLPQFDHWGTCKQHKSGDGECKKSWMGQCLDYDEVGEEYWNEMTTDGEMIPKAYMTWFELGGHAKKDEQTAFRYLNLVFTFIQLTQYLAQMDYLNYVPIVGLTFPMLAPDKNVTPFMLWLSWSWEGGWSSWNQNQSSSSQQQQNQNGTSGAQKQTQEQWYQIKTCAEDFNVCEAHRQAWGDWVVKHFVIPALKKKIRPGLMMYTNIKDGPWSGIYMDGDRTDEHKIMNPITGKILGKPAGAPQTNKQDPGNKQDQAWTWGWVLHFLEKYIMQNGLLSAEQKKVLQNYDDGLWLHMDKEGCNCGAPENYVWWVNNYLSGVLLTLASSLGATGMATEGYDIQDHKNRLTQTWDFWDASQRSFNNKTSVFGGGGKNKLKVTTWPNQSKYPYPWVSVPENYWDGGNEFSCTGGPGAYWHARHWCTDWSSHRVLRDYPVAHFWLQGGIPWNKSAANGSDCCPQWLGRGKLRQEIKQLRCEHAEGGTAEIGQPSIEKLQSGCFKELPASEKDGTPAHMNLDGNQWVWPSFSIENLSLCDRNDENCYSQYMKQKDNFQSQTQQQSTYEFDDTGTNNGIPFDRRTMLNDNSTYCPSFLFGDPNIATATPSQGTRVCGVADLFSFWSYKGLSHWMMHFQVQSGAKNMILYEANFIPYHWLRELETNVHNVNPQQSALKQGLGHFKLTTSDSCNEPGCVFEKPFAIPAPNPDGIPCSPLLAGVSGGDQYDNNALVELEANANSSSNESNGNNTKSNTDTNIVNFASTTTLMSHKLVPKSCGATHTCDPITRTCRDNCSFIDKKPWPCDDDQECVRHYTAISCNRAKSAYCRKDNGVCHV